MAIAYVTNINFDTEQFGFLISNSELSKTGKKCPGTELNYIFMEFSCTYYEYDYQISLTFLECFFNRKGILIWYTVFGNSCINVYLYFPLHKADL